MTGKEHYEKYGKKAYQKNKSRYAENRKRWAQKNKLRRRVKAWATQGMDLTYEQFLLLCEQAEHRCQICKEHKPLLPDHDHKTGRVRGVLCRQCNAAIGLMYDSADNVERALGYLRGP